MQRMFLTITAALGAVMPLVFDSALKGVALLLLAALCALALHRASAATRHLVWLVAVAALLFVPVLSAWLPQWRVLPAWAVPMVKAETPTVPVAPSVQPDLERPGEGMTENAVSKTVEPGASPEPGRSRMASADSLATLPPLETPAAAAPESHWRRWLPMLWVAGFAFCCLRLLAAHWLIRRKATHCREVTSGPLREALRQAREQLGVRQRVRLLVDDGRTIPVVWGIFRPTLVLPAEAKSWHGRQLQSVLLHELAHVRRWDTMVQLLTQVACALHWFNPLVWLAAWRLHAERERACDDLVLASGVRASDYAEHLLHVATRLSGGRWTSACGLAMARPSRLEGRLIAVLSNHLNRRRVTAALALAALVLGAGMAIPIAMLRAADEQEWNPPQAAHIGMNTRSAYCVHDGTKAEWVIFHPGGFSSSSTGSQNQKARTWTDAGAIKLEDGKTLEFLRSHTAPEVLTIAGRGAYDLAKGRVFYFNADGSLRQLPLQSTAVRDQASLAALEKRVNATLGAMGPQLRAEIQIQEAPQEGAKLPLSLLEGIWGGEKSGVKVELSFPWLSEHQEARWRVQSGDNAIGADMSVVPAEDRRSAQLVFRKGFAGERTLGRLTAREDGALELEVTAEAEGLKNGYQAVSGLVLNRQAGHARMRPRHDYAQSLLAKWKQYLRSDGKVPGALIGQLAEEVDSFMKQAPADPATAKFRALRGNMNADHDWAFVDAVALLDDLTAIATAPVSWADLRLEFSGMKNVTPGKALPEDLKDAPWGKPAENGLRAAWIFDPRAAQYPVGSVVKTRVLFHNAGKEPVMFSTETWLQYGTHQFRTAKGETVTYQSTIYSGITPTANFRLEPGECCEVAGHGFAIGAGKYEEERSLGQVGAIVECKAGDEVIFTSTADTNSGGWTRPNDPKDPGELFKKIAGERVKREAPNPKSAEDRALIVRRTMLDLLGVQPTPEEVRAFVGDNSPEALDKLTARLIEKRNARQEDQKPVNAKLPTGEFRFLVVAADPNAAKAPGVAKGPGRYVLSEGVHLLVSRLTEGGEDTNKAVIAFMSPDPKVASPHKPYDITLPGGMGSFTIVWERNGGSLWVGEKGRVRRVDFEKPDAVREERDEAAKIPARLRELLIKVVGTEGAATQEAQPSKKETGSAPAGFPQKFRGLDLGAVKHTMDSRELADIWVADEGEEMWTVRPGSFQMPIYGEEKAWLQYAPRLGLFYLDLDDAEGKDHFFGPFHGDPFTMLGLREEMVKRMSDWGQAGDVRRRAERMLRIPSLRTFACELLLAIHPPISLDDFDDLIAELKKAQGDEKDKETAALLAKTLANAEKLAAAREAGRVKVADDDYSKAGSPMTDFKKKDVVWGPLQDSLAVGVWISKPEGWRQGDDAEVELWVRNSGAKAVRFQHTPRFDAGLQFWLIGKDGRRRDGQITQISTPLFGNHLKLDPGQVFLAKKFEVMVRAPRKEGEKPDASWQPRLEVEPGRFQLVCSVGLPGFEKSGRGTEVMTPAAGEWHGTLTSAERPITVRAEESEPAKPAEGAAAKDPETQAMVARAREELKKAEVELARMHTLVREKAASQSQVEEAMSKVEVLKAEVAGDSAAAWRAKLKQAENSLARISALHESRVVSATELEKARADVQIVKAEMAGDAAAAARARLAHAEINLRRLSALDEQRAVSAEEFEKAKLEVQVLKAEVGGDRAAATRARLAQAEVKLQRVQALYEQKMASGEEVDTARVELERMRAELNGDSAALRRVEVLAAEQKLKRVEALFQNKLVPAQELENAKAELRAAQEKLAAPKPGAANLDGAEKSRWSATGTVKGADGEPMEGVEIWVHAGQGSLFRTGQAKTGADGRYTVEFGPGMMSGAESAQLQFAQITAHKAGFFEKNLNRQGAGAMATREVEAEELKGFGGRAELALPGRPRTVDFVMLAAGRIKGRLVGTGSFSNLSPEQFRKDRDGKEEKTIAGYTELERGPLGGWRVWLKGKAMPPGAGVICTAKTDGEGNFEMSGVPVGYDWQFLTETTREDVREPLSPAFRLEKAGEAAMVLELPEEQKELRFLGQKL